MWPDANRRAGKQGKFDKSKFVLRKLRRYYLRGFRRGFSTRRGELMSMDAKGIVSGAPHAACTGFCVSRDEHVRSCTSAHGAGRVEGSTSADGKVQVFKGIPYAAPPVGAYAGKSRNPRRVGKAFGRRRSLALAACRRNVFDDMVFRDAAPSEDCLYLNVWTPKAVGRCQAAGDGLDLRRRFSSGSNVRAAPGRRASRAQGRGRRQHELSPGEFLDFSRTRSSRRNRRTMHRETTVCRIKPPHCNGFAKISRRLAAIRTT